MAWAAVTPALLSRLSWKPVRGPGGVAADDVARNVVEHGVRVDLDGEGEVAGPQVHGGRWGYEDVGAAAVEDGAVGREVRAMVLAVVAVSGVIAAVARERPVREQACMGVHRDPVPAR